MRALILGAKSAIAQAIVTRLEGYDFALCARQCQMLEPFAADLRLKRSCQVDLVEFDALDFAALKRLPQQIHDQCGEFDLVVLAFGYLGDQQTAERDADEMATTLNANFTGAVIALSHLANYLEARQQPGGIIATTLIGIAGAVVGGFLASLGGLGSGAGFIGSLVIAVAGAILLLFLYQKFFTKA